MTSHDSFSFSSVGQISFASTIEMVVHYAIAFHLSNFATTVIIVVIVVVDVDVDEEEEEEEEETSSADDEDEEDAILAWSTPKHIPVP